MGWGERERGRADSPAPGFTGELAAPAEEVVINTGNLLFEEGIAHRRGICR